MKKKIFLLTSILSATALLFLSSCLKDKSHDLNFGNSGTFVDFPKGGATNFGGQAITESPDATGAVTRVFAVNIASPELQATATTVTFKVGDQASVDAYNSSQTLVHYDLLPTNAYTLYTSSVIIPAKQLFGYDSVKINKNLLDPAKSYMLPITIATTTNGKLTTNLNTLLYHLIGNDFAGSYMHAFQRYNEADSLGSASGASFSFAVGNTSVFLPVSPTEFTTTTGYGPGLYTYDVTFTKNADGTYSNFAVSFTAASIAAALPSPVLTKPPVFFVNGVPADNTLAGPYTFAQAIKLFHFQFQAHTSADRYLIDTYKK